jgi:hypothetical protein
VVCAVTTLAETTTLAASRGDTTALAVLVHRVANPVDLGVIADNSVLNINEDNFEIFVGSIGVDPV